MFPCVSIYLREDHFEDRPLQCLSHANSMWPAFPQFAVQIAVIFTKVARVDYPRYWPSLIDDLLGVLSGGDMLRRRRGYLVLHHVLKELSSKRLASDQRTFAQVWLGSRFNLTPQVWLCDRWRLPRTVSRLRRLHGGIEEGRWTTRSTNCGF